MKFVKRSIYLLLAIAMVFSFNAAIEYETLAVEKMNDELLELMSWVSDTTPFSVMIELKDKVPQDKLKKALDEVYKEYDMDEFYASEADYIGNDKAYEEDFPKLNAHYDAYHRAKMKVYDSFYFEHNKVFLEKYNLETDDKNISSLISCIHSVTVNKEIINKMLYDSDILEICFMAASNGYDAGDVTDAMQYVRGDINDLGVTGSGIQIGIIEDGSPNINITPNFVANLSPSTHIKDHANETSKIIKLLSPNCQIYSYALTYETDELENSKITTAIEVLSNSEKNDYELSVDVINISYAQRPTSGGAPQPNAYTRAIDDLIERTNVPVVMAAGNAGLTSAGSSQTQEGTIPFTPVLADFRLSTFAVSYNSICVGGMSAPGTAGLLGGCYENNLLSPETPPSVWTKSGSMEMYLFSCWEEGNLAPNKPDLVAPAGAFDILGKENMHGTSYAAPHVTSSIAWMLARNVYMKQKPEQIKAAVIGSAYTRNNDIKKVTINDKPLNTPINWTNDKVLMDVLASEDYRGAGVLNAAYCYNVAYLGQRAEFTFTALNQTKTYNVTVSNNGLPFRLAIAWNALSVEGNNPNNNSNEPNFIGSLKNKYDITIVKSSNNAEIDFEITSNDVYKAITIPAGEIQKKGGGTYKVTITCTQYSEANDVVGMTWNNLNPVGYAPYNNH